jgi:MFS family permease
VAPVKTTKENFLSDSKTARAALMRSSAFRWLLLGGVISGLGDQFTLIALPWLVLKMTADPLALGLVVALMGVPRAIFILFGGALVDRHSPKRVLMLTKYANTVLLGVLAALVLSGSATLALVGALALAIGLASAFSIPSGTSVLPQVVAPEQLQLANGMLMSIRQVTMLAGPLLAGLLFVLAGDGSAGLHDARGLGLAFGLDSISFAVSAWTLAKVSTHAAPPAAPQPILRAIGAGLALVWNDATLRTCFLYWAVCSCVVGGIMQVAMPVLASTRLHGAAALGVLMGAYGAGTLAGMALTSVMGNLRIRNLGTTLLLIDAIVGAALLPLGHISATWQAVLINLVVGVLAGFMQVAVFTWIQQRVPRPMLGRTMSIFMFVFMGLAPLAAALAGWVMTYTPLPSLFTGAGLFLVGAAVLAYACTPMRAMVDAPAARQG